MVNITMLIISTIWFTLDLLVSGVPRPYLHMLGSSSLTRVFCVCKTSLHPLYVNVESITPDHHMEHEGLSQWCILRENTYTLKFSEGSSYNATDVLSNIRCIKDKHHMQSKYVTWYGHHHLVPLISISKVLSWSPSSPAWHHDLYQHVVTWSSRQLWLSHSDKVKQLYGACILCNKATTLRLLPIADNFYKTWSSHTTIYISSRLDHITSQHTLQKQVRRPLLCYCKFYMAATGWARTVLTYASKPQR